MPAVYVYSEPPDEVIFRKSISQDVDFMTIMGKQVPFSTPDVEGKKPNNIVRVDKNIIKIDGKQAENYILHCNAANCNSRKIYFSVGKNYYEITFDISGEGLQY